jgi:hypothetical protein
MALYDGRLGPLPRIWIIGHEVLYRPSSARDLTAVVFCFVGPNGTVGHGPLRQRRSNSRSGLALPALWQADGNRGNPHPPRTCDCVQRKVRMTCSLSPRTGRSLKRAYENCAQARTNSSFACLSAKHGIAAYVGTSRGIVSGEMNQMRKAGLVRYSRLHIDINSLAVGERLRQLGIGVPPRGTAGWRRTAL